MELTPTSSSSSLTSSTKRRIPSPPLQDHIPYKRPYTGSSMVDILSTTHLTPKDRQDRDGDNDTDTVEEKEEVVVRKDKGKGKMKMTFLPEIPDEIWTKIFEIYYEDITNQWHSTGTIKDGVTPILISRDHARIAIPVLYRHPYIGYTSITPFISTMMKPSQYTGLCYRDHIKHLTIRPSPIIPAIQFSAHYANRKPTTSEWGSGNHAVPLTIHPSFEELLGNLPPELSTFTLKDTLVLHSPDAKMLFSGLRLISPKKVRLEFRMWDLYDSPYGQDIMGVTRGGVYASYGIKPLVLPTPDPASAAATRNVQQAGHAGMQKAWRDALFDDTELDLPPWWLEVRPEDNQHHPQYIPQLSTHWNPNNQNPGNPFHTGIIAQPQYPNPPAPPPTNPLALQQSIANLRQIYSNARRRSSSLARRRPSILNDLPPIPYPTIMTSTSSSTSQNLANRNQPVQAPQTTEDTSDFSQDLTFTLTSDDLVDTDIENDDTQSVDSRDNTTAITRGRRSASPRASPTSSNLNNDRRGSPISSRRSSGRTGNAVASSSSSTSAINQQLQISNSSVHTNSLQVNYPSSSQAMVPAPHQGTRSSANMASARRRQALAQTQFLSEAPVIRYGPGGVPMTPSPGMTTHPLAHYIRRLLSPLLTEQWAPRLQALSFVALDPLASLIVRAPELDFWSQIAIPHIRVHLPRSVNPLSIFKTPKEVARDRARRTREQGGLTDQDGGAGAPAPAPGNGNGNIPNAAATHQQQQQALLTLTPQQQEDNNETYKIVGGDGNGNDLIHKEIRLFELEINSIEAMRDEVWIRYGDQLPPQLCRILAGEHDWRDVSFCHFNDTYSPPYSEYIPAESPATSDFDSPTFSFVSLNSDEFDQDGEAGSEDERGRNENDTYDKGKAEEQAKRVRERSNM